ncbi:FecR family protein [Chitinophaga jiangningensis]|nr:FecR domain-containing protein [Chitinophaga jiangningensis]
MDENTEKRIYDLLSKKMTGDASTEELQALENLLFRYPEFRFLHDELGKPDYDQDAAAERALQAFAVHYYGKFSQDMAAAGHDDKASTRLLVPIVKQRSGKVWLKAAAVIAVPFLLGLGFYLSLHDTEADDISAGKDVSEMVTQKASKSKIRLPDGTTVMLNADSKISYSKNFGAHSRSVILEGEAYFDVVSNAESPFVIHTENADIRVLGTTLNVRSYPGEAKFETSLINGKVEVSLKNSKKAFILKPSEKLVLPKNNVSALNLTQVRMLDSAVVETAWIKGQLSFVDEPFSAIAAELERQYNVTFEFNNTDAMQHRYTGIFDKTKIEDVLNILKLIKPFNYTITNNTVIIF